MKKGKINNTKISDPLIDLNDVRRATNIHNVAINTWLKQQETNTSGLRYEWCGDGPEPPNNWYNCDIKKILHHINSHTNIDNDKTSITPGTTILHKNIWYDTYEDWFFDNYNIIPNSESVSQLYNKLFSIIDNAGYTISNIKRFKNELIYFIYKNST